MAVGGARGVGMGIGEMEETVVEVVAPAFFGVAPLILIGRAPINCPCISVMALIYEGKEKYN